MREKAHKDGVPLDGQQQRAELVEPRLQLKPLVPKPSAGKPVNVNARRAERSDEPASDSVGAVVLFFCFCSCLLVLSFAFFFFRFCEALWSSLTLCGAPCAHDSVRWC